jgi:D,D-heptose 1,7-bisphosphate phosphatase
MPQNKALFLDRDGTIVKEIQGSDPGNTESLGYLTSPSQVEIIEGSAEAISLARSLGYKIIIITNQSAIARGWLTKEELSGINNRMHELLLEKSSRAIIDGLYYSPFHKEGVIEEFAIESPMRKPGTGMIDEAKGEHDIDTSASYLIGDAFVDMKTAENAGIKSILVMTGYGKIAYKKCLDEKVKIDFIADNLFQAVKLIEKNDI